MWAQQRVDIVSTVGLVRRTRGADFAQQISVLPAQTRSLVMMVDNPGSWAHHCQVLNHRDMGMISMYTAG